MNILLILLPSLITIKGSLLTIPASSIKQVTISGYEAEIQKEFKASSLKRGYHTLIIRDLPESVDEKTIRIKGKGFVELLSTMVENAMIYRDQDEEYIKVFNNLQNIIDELSRLHQLNNFELERIKLRVNTVKLYTYMTINSSQLSITNILSLDKINDYITYQDEVMKKSNTEMQTVLDKLNTLDSLNKTFSNCIDRLRFNGIYVPRNWIIESSVLLDGHINNLVQSLPSHELSFLQTIVKKNLHIRIYIPEDTSVTSADTDTGTHTFELTYGANPAQWHPQYDIKVENKEDETGKYLVILDFFAAVEQRTGENWPDVKLILSSAIPKHNIYRPDWNKKVIKFQENIMHEAETLQYTRSRASPRMKIQMEGAMPKLSQDSGDSMPEMVTQAASVTASGDLGSAYHFTCNRAVNISTSPRQTSSPARHRLFIDSIHTPATVFTYVVPTQSSIAYLQAWGTLKNVKSGTGGDVPLLHSSGARVFLQGAYTGTTYIPSTQPGGELRLDLGEDQNMKVTYQYIPPTHRSGEEDKSTWFITDKKKFRFKIEEHSITIKSTYTRPHLVIIAEHVPRSTEEDIKIELQSPSSQEYYNFAQNQGNEYDLLNYVINDPEAKKSDKKTRVYYSDSNKLVIWAVLINPRETVNLSLKYRISWPDGKNIVMESY